MSQQSSPSQDHPLRQMMRGLNHVFAEFNVFLLAVAIGIAVLDLTGFVVLRASAELARTQQSAFFAMPSPSPPNSIASR
ncbi:MAG TPA: hypothetical protein VGS13_00810 [Stellaceae bacterium]|nr:hypothetical protein [Stellaceae bacterium]